MSFDKLCGERVCTGVDKCGKYCRLTAGKALANYLFKIRTTQSSFGDLEKGSNGNYMSVTGHEIFNADGSNKAKRMTPIGRIDIAVKDKFQKVNGEDAVTLLRDYMSSTGVSKEATSILVKRLSDINKNRELVIPLRVGTGVKMIGKEHIKGTISSIYWKADSEKKTVDCLVGVKCGEKGKLTYERIEDYGCKYIADRIDFLELGQIANADAIRFTENGMVRPVSFSRTEDEIVFDSTYVYSVFRGYTSIIGTASGNSYTMNIERMKGLYDRNPELVKYISTNMGYMSKYINLLAPYKFVETNKIILN